MVINHISSVCTEKNLTLTCRCVIEMSLHGRLDTFLLGEKRNVFVACAFHFHYLQAMMAESNTYFDVNALKGERINPLIYGQTILNHFTYDANNG